MSTVQTSNENATGSPPVKTGEMRLEVVVVPVRDVDRAKRFYEMLGWRLDADLAVDDDCTVVQLTPRVPAARSSSARASRQPHPARRKAYSSRCTTSTRLGPTSSGAGSMSASRSTT